MTDDSRTPIIARREPDPELRCGAESGWHDDGDWMDCERRIGHLGDHVHFTSAQITWPHGSRPGDDESRS